jgi:hypothetical protein
MVLVTSKAEGDMTKHFETPEGALLYMTECTLATVERAIMKSSYPKSELKRQINIAQVGVSFFHHRNIKTSGRVLDVCLDYDGDVAAWAEE